MPAIVDRFVWKKRTKRKAGIRWDIVVENIWKEIIGGNMKKEIMSIEDGEEYKTKVSDMMEIRDKKALRQKVDEEEDLMIYGGLREGIGMKTYYLHGPIDYAKTLELRFRIGDLDLPERRKM